MDKLKDIFASVKERISNPFTFSFICAWIIYNWKIVVAFAYYEVKPWEEEKYSGLFQYIDARLDMQNSIWYPFRAAVLYVIVMPVIKNLIKVLNTWIDSLAEGAILRINKNGKVSIDKYIQIKEGYDSQKKKLEAIILSEASTQQELQREKGRVASVEQQKDFVEQEKRKRELEIERLLGAYQVSFLNGKWRCSYSSKNPPFAGEENIIIENGTYSIEDQDGKIVDVFNIEAFHYDEITRKVRFVKNRIGQRLAYAGNTQNPSFKIYYDDLTLRADESLDGVENGSILIKYTKR